MNKTVGIETVGIETVGAEKVKAAVKVALDIVLQYKKAKSDDGEIKPVEYLGFMDELLAVIKLVPNAKELLVQLQDIDNTEVTELVAFVESYDILKEKAKIIVANVLYALESLYDVYMDNIVPIIKVLQKDAA